MPKVQWWYAGPLLLVAGVGLCAALAATQSLKAPAPQPVAGKQVVAAQTPAAAGQQGSPAGPSVLAGARQAGASRCAARVEQQTSAIPGSFSAFANWAKTSAESHMLQEYLAMSSTDSPPVKSIGIVVAAPTPQGCDTTTLRVLPVPLSCEQVKARRQQSGQQIADFNGLLITPPQLDMKQILVPAGDSCVTVFIETRFDDH